MKIISLQLSTSIFVFEKLPKSSKFERKENCSGQLHLLLSYFSETKIQNNKLLSEFQIDLIKKILIVLLFQKKNKL